jgi:myo-inositol-1(or 4)-monophosphatase
MKNMQNEVILELTKKLSNFFGPAVISDMKVNLKADRSFVTEIDLFVSTILKTKLATHPVYRSYAFFCEEDFLEYTFPCAILDPIDGTRELVKGIPECAVSLALMKSHLIADPQNFAWLYNPFSGFSLDTNTPFVSSLEKTSQKLLALVSRTEVHKGYFDNYNNHEIFSIAPRGSIAFKLGLLSSGACDFVISLAPKNVWDIAAGTILCERRGIHFYENGKRVDSLDRQHYSGVLFWAPENLAPIIRDIFKKEFTSELFGSKPV